MVCLFIGDAPCGALLPTRIREGMPLGRGLCLNPLSGPLQYLAWFEDSGGNHGMFGKNLSLRIQQGCRTSAIQEVTLDVLLVFMVTLFLVSFVTGTEDEGRQNISVCFAEDPDEYPSVLNLQLRQGSKSN